MTSCLPVAFVLVSPCEMTAPAAITARRGTGKFERAAQSRSGGRHTPCPAEPVPRRANRADQIAAGRPHFRPEAAQPPTYGQCLKLRPRGTRGPGSENPLDLRSEESRPMRVFLVYGLVVCKFDTRDLNVYSHMFCDNTAQTTLRFAETSHSPQGNAKR